MEIYLTKEKRKTNYNKGGEMNRKNPAFIIITILSLLLLNNFILASSKKIRKEVRVYDTFENYKMDKPFKVYQSEKEYNLDVNIKNDPTYIKKIITTDELNPSKSYCNEIVPNFYLKQYEEFTGLNNRNAKNLKKLIVLYDSVEKMQKYKAVKLYKSDNCERELEQDMRTIFKGREDLIKIVYRYNKFNKIIFYREHRIPACHLDKYLDLEVTSGKISTFEAYEITKREGNEKSIWYDHNKNYIREKRIKDSKSSNSNTEENILKHRRSKPKPGRFHDIQPPPFLGSIEEQNRYLIEKSIAEYNKTAKDKIISPYDDPMATHVGYLNNQKRRNSLSKGIGHFPSAPTGLSVQIPKTDIPTPTSKESVMPLIPNSNMQAYNSNIPNSADSNGSTQTSTTVIDTEVNELNQYTRFGDWSLDYDLNGNTIQKGTQKFEYDYRNNLVRAEDLNTIAAYKFDTLNRRLEKKVNGKVTKYYYDSNFQVIEERDGNDQVLKQYVYGNRIDEILLVKIFQGPYPGTYYYHTNGSGSVTAITDQEGNLVERVSYGAWGVPTFKDYLTDPNNPITREYSVIGNEILWHGRRYDPETHMYYFRNRTYDPTMGRFLQTDPMGYKDSMNLYQAFNMNPVNFMDPFGRELYISGDATTLTIMKAWLNRIAGFLGNSNLLKFTKYSRDQFDWSGDSHDFPGYVDALEGTYKVEFITPQKHKYRENVGAWLISNLIESKKKYLVGIGNQYPSESGPIDVYTGDVGVAENLDRNYDWRTQDEHVRIGSYRYTIPFGRRKSGSKLPPEGVDSLVWFAPHFVTNFNAGLIMYSDINSNNLGVLDYLEFTVFHELMEAWLKVDKEEPYQYRSDRTKGAHPYAIEFELTWRKQLNTVRNILGIPLFNLNVTGGRLNLRR